MTSPKSQAITAFAPQANFIRRMKIVVTTKKIN